ncbi:MAG: rod shape-determining protein RodA [Puniceicoccales bacterium]|nr:rod shape-determining protein RodA [Puniceicoccales bacterium]
MSFLNWEGELGAFFRRTDWLTPLILLGLTTWSVLAIYSTNSLKVPDFFAQEFARKQLLYVAVSWVAYWGIALLDVKVFERFAWWLYVGGIALLLPVAACAVLGVDIGSFIPNRFGARRWIVLSSFSIQPGEFAKISTLILLALMAGHGVSYDRLSWVERKLVNISRELLCLRFWRNMNAPLVSSLPLLVRAGWLVGLPFGLIFVQPDLGSALTYIPMAFALLLIANIPLRFFAFLAVLTLPFAAVLATDMVQYGRALQTYQMERPAEAAGTDPAEAIRKTHNGLLPIRNYHRERIMTLFAPQLIDPNGNGKNWQPTQARMAVARGELSGQGFQQGTLVRLGWLPETAAHNDFLFSCISEESGFIGGCSIIGLFGLLIALALRTAAGARDKFGTCLAIGVIVFAAVHVVVNVGMNIGLMPVTGVSLPFLSYGGSFILSCFLLFGMVQSVHRSSRPFAVRDTQPAGLSVPTQLSRRAPV